MNQLIQSIIFAVMGAVVIIAGLIEKTGFEIPLLGALIFIVAFCGIIMAITEKNKNKDK